MQSWFSSKALRDGIVLGAVALAVWYLGLRFDLMDRFIEFAHAHEEYKADALLLSLFVLGLFGFVYAFRRMADLRVEVVRRHKAEADTNWIAQHDLLTQLPNRRLLDAFVATVKPDDRLTVYALDLDGFKKVNDLIGHNGGNDLLVEIANRLIAVFPNDLIVRLGGDEFVVVAKADPAIDPEAKARRLVLAIERPIVLAKIQVQVGASIGIALYPDHGDDFAEMLRMADVALYAAKRRGRNHVAVFEPAMDEALTRRSEVEGALRRAITRNEITPHYQPLVDLSTGGVRGFEALARWHTADGKVVPPKVFIELAEEAGLITLLSEQLFRKACADATNWPSDMVLAFNISPGQLADHLLGHRIVQILDQTGLSPHRLEIEITEDALVKDIDGAVGVVEALHAVGARVALDDFGTGYSSLGQLSRLKFDKVKIDRSFVSTFEGDAKQEKIVRAIIGLGHGLGIVTTAEGIEDEHTWERLRAMGCDFGQGYYFGKAMAPSEVLRFFQTNRQRA